MKLEDFEKASEIKKEIEFITDLSSEVIDHIEKRAKHESVKCSHILKDIDEIFEKHINEKTKIFEKI